MATWVSWLKLELADYTELEGQPASIPASTKDPPSALVAVCGNKSPDHDQNRPPNPACTWGRTWRKGVSQSSACLYSVRTSDQTGHYLPQGVKPRNVAGSPASM